MLIFVYDFKVGGRGHSASVNRLEVELLLDRLLSTIVPHRLGLPLVDERSQPIPLGHGLLLCLAGDDALQLLRVTIDDVRLRLHRQGPYHFELALDVLGERLEAPPLVDRAFLGEAQLLLLQVCLQVGLQLVNF